MVVAGQWWPGRPADFVFFFTRGVEMQDLLERLQNALELTKQIMVRL
jgi:hypothetical protein